MAVLGIFYLNIVTSVASVVLAALNVMMRSSILKDAKTKKVTVNIDPMDGITMTDIKKDPCRDVEQQDGSCVNKNKNSQPEATLKQSPRTEAETISPLFPSSVEKPEKVAVATTSLEDTSIRDWLLSLMPGIDGPTLHAVSQAFEKDSIETYGNMVECFHSGAIEVSDIKAYLFSGGLAKMKASKVLSAVHKIAKEAVV